DDPELRRRAYLVGDLGIARHGSSSAWPCGVPGGGETPGLLLGLAGIGYFYLRLHSPSEVPSILLVEPSR
ncbi:MAG: lanthionine synthetase LanC family protein, partial [Rhodopila sp.]|nr:lanthionine synthetase LanC family protein [Rhodopila sp.]